MSITRMIVSGACFFLVLALQAQAPDSSTKTCDATDWKARAENLEQQVAALNEQMAAMGSFFNAKDKVSAIKAQEPPKPKVEK